MADVKVQQSKDNAVLLLDAAEKAKEEANVVRTSGGYLVVDEALAKKAGVEYTTEDDEAKAFDAKVKADDEEAGVQRDKSNPRKVTAKKVAAKKTTAAEE
jgi:hypothetical protein